MLAVVHQYSSFVAGFACLAVAEIVGVTPRFHLHHEVSERVVVAHGLHLCFSWQLLQSSNAASGFLGLSQRQNHAGERHSG